MNSQESFRLVHLNYLSWKEEEEENNQWEAAPQLEEKELTGSHKSAETELWCPFAPWSSFISPQSGYFHLHLQQRSKLSLMTALLQKKTPKYLHYQRREGGGRRVWHSRWSRRIKSFMKIGCPKFKMDFRLFTIIVSLGSRCVGC